MHRFLHPFRPALAVALALTTLLAACAPSPPPIVLLPPTARPGAVRARQAARIEPCVPASRSRLSEAEKSRLFDDFDAWQGDRRPEGAAAAAVPPPAPGAGMGTAGRACRVVRN